MPKADGKPVAKKAANTALTLEKFNRAAPAAFGELEDEREFFKVLYYGPEGSGKSTSALTMATHGRVLLINAEGGAKRRALQQHGINTTNIAVWPQRQGELITISGLLSVYDRIAQDLSEDPHSWFGIVFDSESDVVQALTSQVSESRIVKARNKGAEIDEVDAYFTDVGDYGTMGKMVADLIRKFRDLPVHVVFTALERRDVDEKTTKVTYGPAVTPSVAVSLLGYVDVVMACKAEDETSPFRAVTKKNSLYRCKDRFNVLPPIFANPTMDRLIEYMAGTLVAETDPDQALLPVPKAPKKAKTTDDDESSEEKPDKQSGPSSKRVESK